MYSVLQIMWYKVNRKKTLDDDMMETPLRRCLTTFDLTLLGIGHMIGAGIFVLTGTVVRDMAGPGAVLSYLFAGLAALLSSLCYAEFGARVPKAGSAYTYTYITIGEFWAFIIGWNIILEYLLGVASVARAFSGSFDVLFDFAIRNTTLTYIGHMDVPMLSHYPDFVALFSIIIVMGFVAVGAKVSVNFNSLFTIINLVVILLIITVGFSYSDTMNWEDPGHGGFLPYGFQGTLAGAATCFYAYIGFDGIATAGEEAKHPEKSLPIATCLAMTIVTVLYMLSSSSLTLLVPYFDVDVAAPFPMAFAERGLNWPKVVVAVGALFGIGTSLTGSMFALPRAVYAMASDGLLFAVFSYVHPRTQTPLVGIVVFGLVASVLALLIDINALVEFLSIGTLLSFTMVAAGVIILRYQTASTCQFKLRPEEQQCEPIDDGSSGVDSDKKKMLQASQSHDDIGKLKKPFQELPLLRHFRPEMTTTAAVLCMGACMVFFCVLVLQGFHWLVAGAWWAIILLILLSLGILICLGILLLHEQNRSFMTFQMPLVPLLPALSMLVNIAMMIKLSYLTWIRLAIWLFVGILIYIFYGQRYSMENKPLSAYSQIVSYAGSISSGPTDNLESSVHHPQPEETSAARYDQAYEEAESNLTEDSYIDHSRGYAEGQDDQSQAYQGDGHGGYQYQDQERHQGQGYQQGMEYDEGKGYQGHGHQEDGFGFQDSYVDNRRYDYQGYQGQGYQEQGQGQGYEYNGHYDGAVGQGHNYQAQPYDARGADCVNGYAPIQGTENQPYLRGQGHAGAFYQGQDYQGQQAHYQGRNTQHGYDPSHQSYQ